MKLKKVVALLLCIVLAFSLVACNSGETNNGTDAKDESKDNVITDITGHEVKVPEKIERVVVLSAGECEIVYALGAGNLVVGRGEYCNYPEEVADVEAVKSGSETNLEQIIGLNPDLVIMSYMDQTEEQVAALEKAGISVCLTKETNIDGVYKSIEVLGKLLGKETEAANVVKEMQDTFAGLQDKVAKLDESEKGKSVYFEVSPLQYGLWTAGADTYMNEIAEMLNLKNAFADISGWAEVSEEQVVERNPDYIVTITMYFGEGQTPEEEILGRKGWNGMDAIKNKAVYNANSDEISRPGPRLADAAEMLYKFVYGE